MAETKQDNAAAYGKIVAKAWRDPAFKAKLLADPQAILKDAGVPVPAGVTVKVVENSASLLHLVLPAGRRMRFPTRRSTRSRERDHLSAQEGLSLNSPC